MKFFHLSDLHIGLKLYNRDLSEDQAYILQQIISHAKVEQPDAVVIAGDIYDKAIPSAEAVTLFDEFLTALAEAVPQASIMLISGNHDSSPRVNVFRQLLCRQNIHMIGMPPQTSDDKIEKVTLTDAFGEVHFYLLPFVKPSMVRQVFGEEEQRLSYDETLHRLLARETVDTKERNVLVSHQFYLPKGQQAEDVERMDSEIRTVGNIDEVSTDVLAPFDYAALGHIHKPMRAGSEKYRYCGTPMGCSLSEAGQEKGILLVEMREKGTVQTTVLPLKPLRQVRVVKGKLQDVLQESCDDYVSVVLTDTEDLNFVDMQDRVRAAFPYLLEIRWENIQTVDRTRKIKAEANLEPFDLCCMFLDSLKEEDKTLLQDIINNVRGVD